MNDFMINMAAHMEGFTDEQVAQIEAILPDLEKLAVMFHTALPTINKVTPVIQMALKTLNAHQKGQV